CEDPVIYQPLRVQRLDGEINETVLSTADDYDNIRDHGTEYLQDDQRYGVNEYEVHSREEHPTGGEPIGRLLDSELPFPNTCNPFSPFDNSYDFKMGLWLIRGNATNTTICSGFNDGILQRSNGS